LSENVPNIQWTGASGQTYQYWIHAIPFSFNAGQAGNYIFAKNVNGTWYAVYIGQTGDLGERFHDHHKRQCILANGATHIHVHTTPAGERARLAEERDLLAAGGATCND
jgi:hypothetical protein